MRAVTLDGRRTDKTDILREIEGRGTCGHITFHVLCVRAFATKLIIMSNKSMRPAGCTDLLEAGARGLAFAACVTRVQ